MTISLERRYAIAWRISRTAIRSSSIWSLAVTLMGCATLGSALTLPGAEPPDQD